MSRSWEVEVGIVCHLANSSEGHVHRAGCYITVTRPTIFVVVRVAEWLARLALGARRIGVIDWCPGVRIRGPTMNRKGKISNNIIININISATDRYATGNHTP